MAGKDWRMRWLAAVVLGGWAMVPTLAQDSGPPVVVRKARPKPKEGGKPAHEGATEAGAKPSAPDTATLMLRCDIACIVSIDGKEVARLEARVIHRHNVPVGEHIVEATGLDGKGRFEEIIKAEGKGQKIVSMEIVAAAAAAAAAVAAGPVTTPPEQFDAAAARVYAALSDVRVAGSAIASALKRNFGFQKASNDEVHGAAQALKRELEALKLLSPGDEPRKRAATDLDRSGGAADQYAQLMTKSLVSAQAKNSARGEAQDLVAQSLAALPGMDWAPDTLQLFAQSAAFKQALPRDIRARIEQDPMDLRLGAETMSSSPLLILDVQKGSLAEELGLKPGDRLLAVDGSALASLLDFKLAVRSSLGRSFTLSFERDGKKQDREVKPPSKLP